MGKVAQIITLITCLAALGFTARSQDLGTSNKLFGGPKPEAPRTAKKKKSKPRSNAKNAVANKPAPRTDTGSPEGKAANSVVSPSVKIDPKIEANFVQLIDAARSAHEQRNYPLAEATYRRAQALIPSDGRAANGLGSVFSDQQRWEDAEKSYRAALKSDGRSVNTLTALSYVLTQPIASPTLSARYAEAEQLARKAVLTAPGNAIAHDQLGTSLEMQGMIGDETMNAYLKAIALSPDLAQAYAHLGRIQRRRGMTDQSIGSYRSAVAKAKTATSMVLVAEAFQSEQRYSEAIPLLRRALSVDPRNPTGLILLGRALTATGEFTDAENVLRKAISATSGGYRAEYLLGRLFIRQGRYADAETAFISASRNVTEFEKDDLAAQFEAVGDGYVREGKSANALAAYRKARTFNPTLKSLAAKIARVN